VTEKLTYYHEGQATTNIMFFEDYALYFEDGMTYRDWIRKYGCSLTDDYGSYITDPAYFYVEEKYLDTLCEPGYGNKLRSGWETGIMVSNEVGFYSNGMFYEEKFFYSYGIMGLKKFESPEGYKFIGWQWDGGFVAEDDILYADEVFNYYLRNGLTLPRRVTFEPVFEPIN
jgi:hypothetical protein